MPLKPWHTLVCVSPAGAVPEDPAAPPVSVSGAVLRRLSAQREPDWQSQRRVAGGTSSRSQTSVASECKRHTEVAAFTSKPGRFLLNGSLLSAGV